MDAAWTLDTAVTVNELAESRHYKVDFCARVAQLPRLLLALLSRGSSMKTSETRFLLPGAYGSPSPSSPKIPPAIAELACASGGRLRAALPFVPGAPRMVSRLASSMPSSMDASFLDRQDVNRTKVCPKSIEVREVRGEHVISSSCS